MAVEVYNKTKAQINLALVETVTKAFLKFYKKSKLDTVIVFIGDKEMQEMNKAYRHKDKVTDVLSFTETDNEEPQPDLLGQIFIDYNQIKRQAKEFSQSDEEELVFILVHGLLHLLGYDDSTEEEAQVMEDLGKAFIKKFKF
jgi:probable rRNA maturation factor